VSLQAMDAAKRAACVLLQRHNQLTHRRSSVTHHDFMLHSHGQHAGYATLPRVPGLLSGPCMPTGEPVAGWLPPGERVRGLATAERIKGRSMAKAKRPRRRRGNPIRPCAWCATPVHGDAVTVTFPDKTQATFHVACLDRYRAVMWP